MVALTPQHTRGAFIGSCSTNHITVQVMSYYFTLKPHFKWVRMCRVKNDTVHAVVCPPAQILFYFWRTVYTTTSITGVAYLRNT